MSSPTLSTPCTNAHEHLQEETKVPEQTPASVQPTLESLEDQITQGLPNYARSARALLEIHERKLYKSRWKFFTAYLRARWQWKRARAYQMLKYARVQRLAEMAKTDGPANERQARAQDQPRAKAEVDKIMRGMIYVGNLYDSLPFAEHQEFLEDFSNLLVDLKQQYKREGALRKA